MPSSASGWRPVDVAVPGRGEVVTAPLCGPGVAASTGTSAAAFGISECPCGLGTGMELRQLRTFEAVVRHRTVTDAAVALEMAPSSVSEQIRTLERSLGVALFERTSTGMRLTG